MPRIGELVATKVWAAAARTLSDLSAEEIFDLPAVDDNYTKASPASSGSADTYGSWVEFSADIGAGKRLLFAFVISGSATQVNPGELEVGEGAAGDEVAVARMLYALGGWQSLLFSFCKGLTDNARIAVRVKDEQGSAITMHVVLMVA